MLCLSLFEDMSSILFEEELLSDEPFPVSIRLQNIDLPQAVVEKLESDPSQLAAATIAFNQRVSLIQGPPGTGKTYVGVQLVKALLTNDPSIRIMCLCYTNHALDSFLESLIAVGGISAKKICRLGNVTKMSETIKECSLQRDEYSKFNKGQFTLHRSYQEQESSFRSEILQLSEELNYSFTSGSWPYVRDIMIDIDSSFEYLFQQFEVTSSDDGMRIVGRHNRTIDYKSGWRAWYEGQERPSWVRMAPASVGDLWLLSREDRMELVRNWSIRANEVRAMGIIRVFQRYNAVKHSHDALRDESKLAAMEQRSIVAATTTFAAKNRNLLDSFNAEVLIVEEAAEILEAHILTNFSPSMKQLIMIGDHLQLRPKVEHYPLRVESGNNIDFDRSLFERLILAGYPHSTLAIQHRMRPEISYFIKGTYPNLKDHPKTMGRDHIRGLSTDVAFIDHRELEQSQGDETMVETSSKVNAFEVTMVMKILNYLIQQGYTGSDIVVLTPYLGQLMALRQELRKHSHVFKVVMGEMDRDQALKAAGDVEDDEETETEKADSASKPDQNIRIATIDNFQGEEAKIIIASLVRSNENRDIGFVSGAERVNVLFSRARDGFFILGNSETFENARSGRGRELWKELIGKLRAKGFVYSGFPVKCHTHGTSQLVCTPAEFEVKCPDGGCTRLCGVILPSCPLKHLCQRKCHPSSNHETANCKVELPEKCPRGEHDVTRICSGTQPQCRGKHRFMCSSGHTCYDECHLIKIRSCNRCIQLQEVKRRNQEKLQKEIELAARETDELELKLQAQIAKLEAEERKRDELAKQRALQENIASAERKLAILQSLHQEGVADTVQDVPALHQESSIDHRGRATEDAAVADITKELSQLQIKNNNISETPAVSAPALNESISKTKVDVFGHHATQVEEQKSSMNESGLSRPEKIEGNQALGNPPSTQGEPPLPKRERKVRNSAQTNEVKHVNTIPEHAAKEARDFTLMMITLIHGDQFVDVIEAVNKKYPTVASMEVLTDITRDVNIDFTCIDHALLFLLAHLSLGLEDSKAVKASQKFFDQCFRRQSTQGMYEGTSLVLYEYISACIYAKNSMYLHKARELAESFLSHVASIKPVLDIPRAFINKAHEIVGGGPSDSDKTSGELSVTTPKLEIDQKWRMIISKQPSGKSPSPAMDALLGLSSLGTVKEKFLEIYDSVTLAKEQGRDLTSSNFNSLFYGNPGTGKTTVAQLFAQFLIEMKLLPGECEILKKTGSELINAGVNDLKKGLESMRDEHGGGVIFVDEAYQLDSTEGHRILDFILGHSEKFKGDFGKLVWIFAGYTKNMEKLLEHNVGLPSRFPNKFLFEDYEDPELLAIFQGLMKRCGADVISLAKGLTVKFKSDTAPPKKQNTPTTVPMSRNKYNNPYYGGVSMQKANEIDEWGNTWQWDENYYMFSDDYGNTTGYGARNLGTPQNPIMSSKDGVGWCYDRINKQWYDRSYPQRISKTYPGKPIEAPKISNPVLPQKPFYVTDEKWMRIAITRLGRLRGVTGFGNARAVRNLFDLCCKRQTNRIADLKRAGYDPDIRQFTRDDLLGPKASMKSLCSGCTAYQELMEMEGLKEVKQSVNLIVKLVATNADREEREQKLLDVALNRIFLGNPGTGKTTVAKLYAEILKHLGLLSKGEVIYKTCSDFIGSALGKSEEITRGILEQAKGCVLVIDEAYGLYQSTGVDGGNEPYREAVINTLVEQIQGKPGEDRAVLLLGYKEEMERMLAKCNPGLARRFQLENAFQFADYDDEALYTILKKRVKSEGLHISDESARFAVKQLAKARARPHFGNAGAVNNLLSDAKLRMQGRLPASSSSAASSFLEMKDFVPEGFTEEVVSEEALFSKLVGNKQIKEKLKTYRNVVEMKRRQKKDVKSVLPFTYIFTGSPGTGKTTVARLMGKMLCSTGIIPCEEVVEKSASDFVTGFVGQSGKQTRDIFEQALGRVLFIDEAYQLNPRVGGSYMSEVVDEIVKLLTSTEYKGKLVVILAGYRQDIDEMLMVNQGLKSRFTERIHFDDFDEETIFDMLCRGVQKLVAESTDDDDDDVSDSVRNHLGLVASRLKVLPGFANGRDVETYLGKLEIAIADQFAETNSDAVTVNALDKALDDLVKLKVDPSSSEDRKRIPVATPPRQASQSDFRPPPPPPAITISTVTKKEEEKPNTKKEVVKEADDDNQKFLSELQSALDRLGLNSADGVKRLSTLPPDHPEILALAHDLALSCGFDLDKVRELLREWSGNQAEVREKIRQQQEEEARAKEEGGLAMIPIWRCGVCGQADQPYIACYVQPYIVRYERRSLRSLH